MKLRKFYLVLSLALLLILFGSGIYLLTGMAGIDTDNEKDNNKGNKLIDSIINDLNFNPKPFNLLLMVSDKISLRNDTNIVFHVNPKTKKVSVVSIPRDTLVDINYHEKMINTVYQTGGAELSVDTFSKLLGIDIDYYLFFKIDAIKEIIDLLGGVYYDVPADLYYRDPTQDLLIDLKKGYQLLDGDKAEQLMRFRKASPGHSNKDVRKLYDGSDLKRIEIQQSFIMELIRQKVNVSYIPVYNQVIKTVLVNIDTNMKLDEAVKYLGAASGFSMDSLVYKGTLPGTTAENDGRYHIDRDKIDEMVKQYFVE